MPVESTTFDPLSDEYVRFARMVCASTDHEEYPLQRIGSGAVVACDGDFYLLTARHVFLNNHASPIGVVVPFNQTGVEWWPSNACVHLGATAPFADDDTFADLAIYSLETPEIVRAQISEFDFLPPPAPWEFVSSQQLFSFGYPDIESELDLEGRRFVSTLTAIEGIYGGTTRHRGLHVFESAYLQGRDPNGLSGGPVTILGFFATFNG